MRIVTSVALVLSLLLGGCTVIEQELKNRGGYLDYVIDRHWMKAEFERHARVARVRDSGFAGTHCLCRCKER